MRYLVLAVVGVGLLTAGIFFPWGDKQVVRADCSSVFLPNEVRSSQSCLILQIDALYWSDHVTIDLRTWETVDEEAVSDPRWSREFHDYKMDGSKYDGNAGLFWGRPIMWFSVGVMVLALAAAVVTRNRDDVIRQAALWGVIGGISFVALGATMGLGGMVIHSGTWSGTFVTRLEPRPGGILSAAGAGLTIFGGLRYHTSEMMQLAGVGGSPLAPIHAWEVAAPETKAATKIKLHLGTPTWTALIAVGLAATLLFVPLAQKDMTLVDCQQERNRGWICEEEFLDVDYGARAAKVVTRDDDGITQTTYAYAGEFQAAYGVDAPLRLTFWALLSSVVALGGGLGLQMTRGRFAPRPTRWAAWGATMLFAALVTAAFLPILLHSWGWPGSPAGHLRPTLGTYLGVAAAMAAIGTLWVTRRRGTDNSA